MFSLEMKNSIVNVVKGLIETIDKPEHSIIITTIVEKSNLYLDEDELNKYMNYKNISEDDIDPWDVNLSVQINHNLIFFAPSNYVKVFHSITKPTLSIYSIFEEPFNLISNHDSGWRVDIFPHIDMKDNLNEHIREKAKENYGIDNPKNDVSHSVEIKRCNIFKTNGEEILKGISRKYKQYNFKLNKNCVELN